MSKASINIEEKLLEINNSIASEVLEDATRSLIKDSLEDNKEESAFPSDSEKELSKNNGTRKFTFGLSRNINGSERNEIREFSTNKIDTVSYTHLTLPTICSV
eukprot:TRINITY_DN9053_c0_g1_i15.p1 TRINITY_DN9053_c0_g1~~TRINITY_DN9053_c0_g1_i15.p1  ORF type:complete len:103 (+),score=24.59 TRINITY_DN9053_c0_g1_i15:167-475(+)